MRIYDIKQSDGRRPPAIYPEQRWESLHDFWHVKDSEARGEENTGMESTLQMQRHRDQRFRATAQEQDTRASIQLPQNMRLQCKGFWAPQSS